MIYSAFLFLHSIVRWFVLAFGINAVLRAWQGSFKELSYGKVHRRSGVLFVSTLHLQLVIGLMLYVVLSPITRLAFSDMGAAMRDSVLRFFAIEHIFGMLVAITIATVGSARIKRADTDAKKHKRGLIYFGLAFLILFFSIPWPFYPAGRPLFSFPF